MGRHARFSAHSAAQQAGLPVFAVSLAAFLVSLIYTYVLTDGGKIMGGQMAIASVVITVLLLFFMWYSWLMTTRSVLR